MPDHETHCLHSLKRYGVRGDEIHTWIDEPSQFFAGSHRQFRHDFETINEAVKVFGIKYGDEMVRNIVLDHWKLDSEGNQNKMMTLVCDRCGRIFLAEKDSEILRIFKGKIPIVLCDHCRDRWSELWMHTYGKKSFATISGQKTLPIETEDLWEMFMTEKLKEIVCFS